MKILRSWICRHYRLIDTDYCESVSRRSQDLQILLDQEKYQTQYLTGRVEELENDRLHCRENHWRIALQLACNNVYQDTCDRLAKAIRESDSTVDSRVNEAIRMWEDLSSKNSKVKP